MAHGKEITYSMIYRLKSFRKARKITYEGDDYFSTPDQGKVI